MTVSGSTPATEAVDGANVAASTTPAAPAPASPTPASKRSYKSLIIGGIAVAAVAAVVAIVLFATGAFGGSTKLPNGVYSWDGFSPFSFTVSEDGGRQTIEFESLSGMLVEDGSNSFGPILRVDDLEYSPQSGWGDLASVRLQFPEDLADGDPTGRWYLEISYQDGSVSYIVVQIDKDGTVRSINSRVPAEGAGSAADILDEALSIDEVYSGVYQDYPCEYATIEGFTTELTLQEVPDDDDSTYAYHIEEPSGVFAGSVTIELDE